MPEPDVCPVKVWVASNALNSAQYAASIRGQLEVVGSGSFVSSVARAAVSDRRPHAAVALCLRMVWTGAAALGCDELAAK